MTDTSAIIVKPSTAQAFETLWKRGRVLFFSAPCGFGKTVLTDTLLDGRPVLRLNAADTGFALPSLEDAWDILLIDNIQDMQEERDWQALCALIRESTDRRFLLLSRGIPAACLMAFQYQKRDDSGTGAGGGIPLHPHRQRLWRGGAAAAERAGMVGKREMAQTADGGCAGTGRYISPFFAAKAFHERVTDGSGDAGAAADLRGRATRRSGRS